MVIPNNTACIKKIGVNEDCETVNRKVREIAIPARAPFNESRNTSIINFFIVHPPSNLVSMALMTACVRSLTSNFCRILLT